MAGFFASIGGLGLALRAMPRESDCVAKIERMEVCVP